MKFIRVLFFMQSMKELQNRKTKLWFKLWKTTFKFVFVHIYFPVLLTSSWGGDGGEGNEGQAQSKHFTSLNTCFGLLVPWEKMLWGCTLAHNCPICSVQMPQTTIAKCLSGFYEAWVGLFKNLDLGLSYLSVIQLHVAVGQISLYVQFRF